MAQRSPTTVPKTSPPRHSKRSLLSVPHQPSKRLSGLQAVQTLSRLNRTHAGKEDTFILDFVNETDEIQRSFQPYFEQTAVAELADPQQLYELSHRIESAQVFWASELESFCTLFFTTRGKMTGNIITELYRYVEPGVDRFKALDEERQEDFRNALVAYIGLYAFLSQVMPYQDADLEKLFTFGRFLELKLPHDPKKTPLSLDGDVALQYYRLEKLEEKQIRLSVADSVQLKGPTDVGTRQAKEDETKLSEIIMILNERFGTEFAKADELLLHQFVEEAKRDDEVVQRAKANALDNFALSMKAKIEAKMIDRMEQNQEVVSRYMRDPQFQEVLFRWIVRKIYDDVREVGA